MSIGGPEFGKELEPSVVEGLKKHPTILALVVMNFGLLTFAFWAAMSARLERVDMLHTMVRVESEVREILKKCVVPNGVQRVLP